MICSPCAQNICGMLGWGVVSEVAKCSPLLFFSLYDKNLVEITSRGVPFVAQSLTHMTRIHDGEGLIPGLAKDPALPHEPWCRSQTPLRSGVAVAVV